MEEQTSWIFKKKGKKLVAGKYGLKAECGFNFNPKSEI
jgi:hypothetical protein